MTLLKAQMNADILTDDLKKKRTSNESYWLIGQPDVRVERIDPSPQPSPEGRGSTGSSTHLPSQPSFAGGEHETPPHPSFLPSPAGRGIEGEGILYRVTVEGFDYYNTKTGHVESGGSHQIAVWLLDTDYDGRSLYPRQVFFPMAGEKEGWARLSKNLKAEIDKDLIEAYRGTVSLPFELGEHKRIAVKIIDDRGIESLKVLELE